MIRWGLFLSPFEWCCVMKALSDESLLEAQDFLDTGRFEQASRLAESALRYDPNRGAAWLLLGKARLRNGELRAAIEAMEHASLLTPLPDEVRLDLALAYGRAGREELSKELLMELAVSGRMSAEAMLRIAMGLEVLGDLTLAMEACRRAGREAPESPVVHYQMAYYATLCGYPASVCEALIRHAVDLDPYNMHYRVGLASLLVRMGRHEEAIGTLEKFVPGQLAEVQCSCCLKRLANLFFDAGDLERAASCAQRYARVQQRCDDDPRHETSWALEESE